MGRPLKESVLEKMDLKASTKDGEVTLGKQVGYNRYLVAGEEERVIVRLNDEYVSDIDAIMLIKHGEDEEPVLKITKNVFETTTCVHPYHLDDEGKVVFDEEDVSFVEADSEEEAPAEEGEE